MTVRDYVDIFIAVFGLLFAIIGALLVMKINRMDNDITQLHSDHAADVTELTILKVKVAENYPSKLDIKDMFEQFKTYLDERFNVVEQIARRKGD